MQFIDPYTNKPETISFHSHRCAGRSHDDINVGQARSPLANQRPAVRGRRCAAGENTTIATMVNGAEHDASDGWRE